MGNLLVLFRDLLLVFSSRAFTLSLERERARAPMGKGVGSDVVGGLWELRRLRERLRGEEEWKGRILGGHRRAASRCV